MMSLFLASLVYSSLSAPISAPATEVNLSGSCFIQVSISRTTSIDDGGAYDRERARRIQEAERKRSDEIARHALLSKQAIVKSEFYVGLWESEAAWRLYPCDSVSTVRLVWMELDGGRWSTALDLLKSYTHRSEMGESDFLPEISEAFACVRSLQNGSVKTKSQGLR